MIFIVPVFLTAIDIIGRKHFKCAAKLIKIIHLSKKIVAYSAIAFAVNVTI